MTLAQLLAAQKKAKQRKQQSDMEHRLQVACVRWFRMQYPEYAHALFAVPNGGRRDAVTGAKLKAEGVLAGVADLILLKSNHDYGALLIEMKTATGRQQESQKKWQQSICANDEYKYIVVRSFDEFRHAIEDYFKNY